MLNTDARIMLLPITPHSPINATQLLVPLFLLISGESQLSVFMACSVLSSSPCLPCQPNSYLSVNTQLWCHFAQQAFHGCIPYKWTQCVFLFAPVIIFVLIVHM